MLITDVFPCEDGHAQERQLLPRRSSKQCDGKTCGSQIETFVSEGA